jgi:hypothetical protein
LTGQISDPGAARGDKAQQGNRETGGVGFRLAAGI